MRAQVSLLLVHGLHTGYPKVHSMEPVFCLRAAYAGKTVDISINHSAPTLAEAITSIAAQLQLSPSTVKVIVKGKPLTLAQNVGATVQQAGLQSGAKVLVTGSKADDVAVIASAREPERTPGFEYEAVRAARRRAGVSRDVQPPQGTRYTFGTYEVMRMPGLWPGPDEALKLLYKLASDPGIRHVMEKHRWQVGKLAEMPPEGLVGVSAVCVLGYNTNKGQSIHLRLRTDDLKGFRKYENIRATLCHELTHNVWGDHDNNFKALCSQLNKEVEQVHAARRYGGKALFSAAAFAEDVTPVGPVLHPAMAATAASSGLTLRQLTRQAAATQSAPAAAAAPGVISTTAVQPVTVHSGIGMPAPNASRTKAANGVSSKASSTGSSDQEDGVEDDVARIFEHFDKHTEELEQMQRDLEH